VTRLLRNAILSTFMGVMATGSAFAGGLVGLDLGFHGGAVKAPDSDSDTNYMGGVQARLHLVLFLAVEVRGSAFKSTYQGPLLSNAELTTYPVQGSILVYPIPLPKVSIYALGGAGYHSYKLEYAGAAGGHSTGSLTGGTWAAHVGAGFDLKLSRSFYINADARYVFFNVDELTQVTGQEANYWTATVGLNWRLF
jgi:hypothetical protein